MLSNVSISKKVIGGIGLVSILGFSSGVAGILMLLNVEREVNEITDYAGPIVETTDDLIAATAEAHKVAVEILADENPETIVVRKQEFSVALERFDADYTTLDALLVNPEMQSILDGAREKQADFRAAVNQMVVAHDTELAEEAEARVLSNTFDKVGDTLLVKLEALAEANEAEMQAAEDRGDALVASGDATVGELNDLLGALFEEDYPAVEEAQNLQIIVEQLEGIATQYLSIEDMDDVAGSRSVFEETAASAAPSFKILLDLAETEADRSAINEVQNTFNAWVAKAQEPEQVFDTHDDMLVAETEADQAAERVDDLADDLIAKLNEIAALGDAISSETDEQAAEQVRLALMVVGALSIGIFAIAGLLFWVVSSTITSPLVRMVRQLRKLADGQLDIKISDDQRGDEIGQLNDALVVFQKQGLEKQELARAQELSQARVTARSKALEELIANFETAIGQVVDSVTQATDTLEASAQTMNTVAQDTSNKSTVVATAAEEASISVQTIATGTEEVSASVGEIGRQAQESSNMAEGAKTEALEAIDKVAALSEAAHEIGSVVTLIQDIAEQTNLLALNATIEAARAGEAGKGFAVVASEVKELAAQTAKATADIAEQVNDIQSATSVSAQAIESVTQSITGLSENAIAIAGAVDQQASATQEIATNVTQTAGGAQEVSGTITSVSESAREAQSASATVMDATKDLTVQSDLLQAEVAKFINGVKAA